MQRPEVEILQSSAEATREGAPKRTTGTSVTSSRSLSISSTPAETYPEKSRAAANASTKPISPTNLTKVSTGADNGPIIGTATCWNALQSIQDAVKETSKATRASRLSSEYVGQGGVRGRVNESIGVAKVGAATCWSKMSKMAWDMTLPDVDASKHHSSGVRGGGGGKSTNCLPNMTGVTHAERLKQMATQSVTAPELPELPPPVDALASPTVDEDGLVMETIENVDS
ncbi:MAG: hypothetical protein SGBAC_012489, partial [Bacillariaceae sp.]